MEEKEKKREESAKHFEAWRADIDKKLRAKVNEARAKRLAEVKAKQEEAAESKKDAESAFKVGNTFFAAQMLIFCIIPKKFVRNVYQNKSCFLKMCNYPRHGKTRRPKVRLRKSVKLRKRKRPLRRARVRKPRLKTIRGNTKTPGRSGH